MRSDFVTTDDQPPFSLKFVVFQNRSPAGFGRN